MAKRLFEDNDAWADVTSRCSNEVEALLGDVLAKVESELGAPVDLRDFHFVGANALASFVADLSIRRRLGDGDEAPRDKSYYPRLGVVENIPPFSSRVKRITDETKCVEREPEWLATLGEGHHKWECSSMLDGSNCLYSESEDPMHDECVNCGQPEERK